MPLLLWTRPSLYGEPERIRFALDFQAQSCAAAAALSLEFAENRDAFDPGKIGNHPRRKTLAGRQLGNRRGLSRTDLDETGTARSKKPA